MLQPSLHLAPVNYLSVNCYLNFSTALHSHSHLQRKKKKRKNSQPVNQKMQRTPSFLSALVSSSNMASLSVATNTLFALICLAMFFVLFRTSFLGGLHISIVNLWSDPRPMHCEDANRLSESLTCLQAFSCIIHRKDKNDKSIRQSLLAIHSTTTDKEVMKIALAFALC